jgi:hypothetical protein
MLLGEALNFEFLATSWVLEKVLEAGLLLERVLVKCLELERQMELALVSEQGWV